MDPTIDTLDEENPKQHIVQDDSLNKTSSTGFMEAAALLTIWSLLVLNEGAIRLVDSGTPTEFTGSRPGNAVLFAAGLAEVVFAMVGLFVGMAAFIFKWFNAAITIASLALQSVLGTFVFLVYVFVAPSFRAADLMQAVGDLTLGQQKFLIVMGILTSFHFCLALQGGQFVFFCRLVCAGTGKDFLMQRSGLRMRAIFWNANLGLAGLWTLITGAVVSSNADGAKLSDPFVFPPNVGLLPGLTIATGIMMIIFGAIGVICGAMGKPASKFYYVKGAVVYLLMYLNFTIVQFGLMTNLSAETPSNFGGPIAMHGGLVYMVVFLGPYFVHLASKERYASQA